MRLQLSPVEAKQVLDQLDAKPTQDLKHVRARLVEELKAAARSKTLDRDELLALITVARYALSMKAGGEVDRLHDQLNTSIPKLEGMLRNLRPAAVT